MDRRTAPALVLGLLVLAGCAVAPAAVAPAPAADLGVSARLLQYRRDVPRRVVQLQVQAVGPGVVVEDVELRLAAYAPTRRTGATTVLRPGSPVDVPLPQGEALCDADPSGPSTALLTVRRDGGPPQQVLATLPDTSVLVGRLHRPECAERALRRSVDVGLVGGFVPDGADGGARRTTLRLRRTRPDGPRVVVPELQNGILFTVRTSADPRVPVPSPVLVLEPGQQVAEVPIVVRAERCDPHALAESKRTSIFRFAFAIDGAEPVQLLLQPDEASRDLLVQYATDQCGRGGAG